MNEATIRLHIGKLADGGFLATSVDVPGLVAEGRSIAEATEIAQGLARKIAESCVEHGDPLPPALADFVEPETGLDLLAIPSACRSGTACTALRLLIGRVRLQGTDLLQALIL